MNVYTYSQARQNFASVLEVAKKKGKVLLRRKDGSVFAIVPENLKKSALDVRGINSSVSTKEIIRSIRESRKH